MQIWLHEQEEDFESDIVYNYGGLSKWKAKLRMKVLSTFEEDFINPGKFEILEGHTFRTRDPAVVGVGVLGGRLPNQASSRK